ncbi:MAG: hypothetical protein ABIG20_05290 [archaeon]
MIYTHAFMRVVLILKKRVKYNDTTKVDKANQLCVYFKAGKMGGALK